MSNLDMSLRFQTAPSRGEAPALTPSDTSPGRMMITPGRSSRPPPTSAGVDTNLPRPGVEPGPAVSPSNTTPPTTAAPSATAPPATAPPATTQPPSRHPRRPGLTSRCHHPRASYDAAAGRRFARRRDDGCGGNGRSTAPRAGGRSLLSRINPLNWFGGKQPRAGSTPSRLSRRCRSRSRSRSHRRRRAPPPPRTISRLRCRCMREIGRRPSASAPRGPRRRRSRAGRTRWPIIKDAIKADPHDYDACLGLGLGAMRRCSYAALDALHHAVTLNPESGSALRLRVGAGEKGILSRRGQ